MKNGTFFILDDALVDADEYNVFTKNESRNEKSFGKRPGTAGGVFVPSNVESNNFIPSQYLPIGLYHMRTHLNSCYSEFCWSPKPKEVSKSVSVYSDLLMTRMTKSKKDIC